MEASKDEFALSQDSCSCCPLHLLPPKRLASLIHPPFRKRHPIIFWSGWLVFVFLIFFVARMAGMFGNVDNTPRLALVKVSGPILDVEPTLNWLRKLEQMGATVKGILLRVDSPGGSAAASQEIYASLERLAAKMPVAVSMGATAASGGLMVSMAGHRVFANPSTITGSIGVRMDIPQLQGLMQKLGIGQETLVTAPYKDATSYLRPMSNEDRAYLEQVLMNMHDQFVQIVAKGRNMSLEQAKALANGKIFTGQQALELGLIDQLGGQLEAQEWLCEATGVPREKKMLTRPATRARLLEKLLTFAKSLYFGEGMDELDNLGAPIFKY